MLTGAYSLVYTALPILEYIVHPLDPPFFDERREDREPTNGPCLSISQLKHTDEILQPETVSL